MTNKEKYRRAFGVLHASEDILTEVTHMETKKHFSLRKAVLLCAAVIAVFAMAGVCYAEDVGGIQRTIQLWCYGDQTDAVLEIQDGSYELTYEAADGVHSEGGGGVAIDAFGRERPLTEEELLEDLQNRIDVTYREDGTVWVYYKDQSMDITDLFDENGVCFVQLKDGKKTVYLPSSTIAVSAGAQNATSSPPSAIPDCKNSSVATAAEEFFTPVPSPAWG